MNSGCRKLTTGESIVYVLWKKIFVCFWDDDSCFSSGAGGSLSMEWFAKQVCRSSLFSAKLLRMKSRCLAKWKHILLGFWGDDSCLSSGAGGSLFMERNSQNRCAFHVQACSQPSSCAWIQHPQKPKSLLYERVNSLNGLHFRDWKLAILPNEKTFSSVFEGMISLILTAWCYIHVEHCATAVLYKLVLNQVLMYEFSIPKKPTFLR